MCSRFRSESRGSQQLFCSSSPPDLDRSSRSLTLARRIAGPRRSSQSTVATSAESGASQRARETDVAAQRNHARCGRPVIALRSPGACPAMPTSALRLPRALCRLRFVRTSADLCRCSRTLNEAPCAAPRRTSHSKGYAAGDDLQREMWPRGRRRASRNRSQVPDEPCGRLPSFDGASLASSRRSAPRGVVRHELDPGHADRAATPPSTRAAPSDPP